MAWRGVVQVICLLYWGIVGWAAAVHAPVPAVGSAGVGGGWDFGPGKELEAAVWGWGEVKPPC